MFISKKRYDELKQQLEKEKDRRIEFQATIRAWREQAILARVLTDKVNQEMAYKMLIAAILEYSDA